MAVSIEGVDYSYDRPTPAGLKAAGKHFVVRYITTPGPGNKGIDKAEYDALRAEGIEVVVVYEGSAGDMKKGHAQGVTDAKAAQANLKGIVGLNDNLPVYFACDWDATPGDQTAINSYLDGAASVLGLDRVGIYGGYYPVKRAHDAKKATWLWQTYAWSGGQILAGIHLYQYKNGVSLANGTVDLCRAMQTEYGQSAVNPPAPPKPVVVPAPAPAPAVQPAPTPTTSTNGDIITLPVYFKGDENPAVYVLNPLTGNKRYVSQVEYEIAVKGTGAKVVTVAQSHADAVPHGS